MKKENRQLNNYLCTISFSWWQNFVLDLHFLFLFTFGANKKKKKVPKKKKNHALCHSINCNYSTNIIGFRRYKPKVCKNVHGVFWDKIHAHVFFGAVSFAPKEMALNTILTTSTQFRDYYLPVLIMMMRRSARFGFELTLRFRRRSLCP